MRKNIYRFLMYVAAFIVGTSPVFLCGCSGAAAGSAAVASLFEDENVQMVKNGHPYAYPDITYGKAFGGFFATPKWEYFKGTRNGSDEDGDGSPDYQKNDIDVVQFTGYCQYADNDNVKAVIQFELNKEDGTFEPVYLSFNDIAQNKLMLLALIEKVFSEAQEKTTSSDSTQSGEKKEDAQQDKPAQSESSSATGSSNNTTSSASVYFAEIVAMYSNYADGYSYRLDISGDYDHWVADISYFAGEWVNMTYTSEEWLYEDYFTAGSIITQINMSIVPYDEYGNAGTPYQTSWDPARVEPLDDYDYSSDVYYGEIVTYGENVTSYTTSYVCENGKPEIVRSNLGNGWHVTAYSSYDSYGITWYELYDTDDGEYYGWVDGTFINFY